MVAGVRNQPHHNLCNHAQRAFRTHHELGKVVAGAVLEGVGSGPNNLTGGEHYLEVENVGRGHAVLDGLGAARVVGHVATHGAAAPRRGVGRIKQTLLAAGLVKYLVDHAGLDGRLKVGRVDFQNAVEAFHAERDSAVDGNGAATQARAGSRWRDRHLVLVGPA